MTGAGCDISVEVLDALITHVFVNVLEQGEPLVQPFYLVAKTEE